jgi:hypothetical protein
MVGGAEGPVARLWFAAMKGRTRYLLHALVGHQVLWLHRPQHALSCSGDIGCLTCDSVLWCRGYDPWALAATSPPADHWGRLAVAPRSRNTHETPGEAGTSVAAATLLEARLNQLLTLADRLPRGASENCVRRCVCAFIEADWADQHARALALLRSITQLQHERELGLRRLQQTGDVAVDRLLTSLRDEVVPMLAPRQPLMSAADEADDCRASRSFRIRGNAKASRW